MAGRADWIAVDWGTSNVRAWGIDDAGETVFSANSDKGMGRLTRKQYPIALDELLAGQPAELDAPILVCGMAGARQGWLEAPYLDTPADLSGLGYSAVSPFFRDGCKIRILPGVCQKGAGVEDVMRGEETQLLGLSRLIQGFSGAVCMPGTHSKWAVMDGARIARFTTVMTGELFEILKTHSVLRHSLNGDTDGPGRAQGFAAGADLGLEQPGILTSLLFKTRAASLLSGRGADWCAGFLSGVLIGSEIGGHRDWIGQSELPLIGSVGLCTLYAEVLARIGVSSRVIDATEATLLGLKAARLAVSEPEA